MHIQIMASPRALGKLPKQPSALQGLDPPVQKWCKSLIYPLRQPFQGAEAFSQSWLLSQRGSSEHLLPILWAEPSWSLSPLPHEWIRSFLQYSCIFHQQIFFLIEEICFPELWVARADSGGKGNLVKKGLRYSPGHCCKLHCWLRDFSYPVSGPYQWSLAPSQQTT